MPLTHAMGQAASGTSSAGEAAPGTQTPPRSSAREDEDCQAVKRIRREEPTRREEPRLQTPSPGKLDAAKQAGQTDTYI